MSKKKNSAFTHLRAVVRQGVELRDQRDAALKAAAAALHTLEAMVASDSANQTDRDVAEDEYESKVKALIELDNTLSATCGNMLCECYTAILASVDPNNLPKA
jgi:hypothetical protein